MRKHARSFFQNESGMTMGLVVVMVVVIGVMGAGLLTFVRTDLFSVVEVNQGQRAFEMSDAGVQAAYRQLQADSSRNKYGGVDLAANDIQWSSLKANSDTDCTSNLGTQGVCLKNLDGDSSTSDVVNVTIQSQTTPAGSFKIISTGGYRDAKRKVEAIVQLGTALSIPRAYFTRGGLVLSGSANADGISLFALGNVQKTGTFGFTSAKDSYFGRWATFGGGTGPFPDANGSYPNEFNKTARGTQQGGVGALGTVNGFATSDNGRQHFGSNTTPRTVENYDASPLLPTAKISFPFKIPTPDDDKRSIDRLRERAIELEIANPGVRYYFDAIPGNGVDDAGMSNLSTGSSLSVNDWYPTSNLETVRFYEFESYSANNLVNYVGGSPTGCPTGPALAPGYPKGALVVQNGDMLMNSNKAFYGAMIVRAYDSSGNLLPPPALASPYDTTASNFRNGSFRAEGSPCLKGYANASGNAKVSGNIEPADVSELSKLSSFSTKTQVLSWRECFSANSTSCT